jgi:hypothetical protein
MVQIVNRAEQCIIVDTSAQVKWLMTELSKCTVAEYNVPELISEAVEILSSQQNVETNLVFVADRLYNHYLYKTNDVNTAKIISVTWMAFVGLLIDVYTQNNLWDSMGRSCYYYRSLMGYDIVMAVYQTDIDAYTLGNYYNPSGGPANDHINRNGVAA